MLVSTFELRFKGGKDLTDLFLTQFETSLKLLVWGTIGQLGVPF